MSIFQLALMVGGGIAAYVVWGNWRAIGWIIALLLDHAVSVAYWDTGLPYPELVAGLCDAAVVMLIYAFGRTEWEVRILWRLFQAMVLVNIIYLAGNLEIFPAYDHVTYSTLLEGLNILILLTIGGFGKRQRIGSEDVVPIPSRHRLYRTLLALRAPRKVPAFWKI